METQEGAEPMDWNQPFRPLSTRKKVAVFMPIRMVQTAGGAQGDRHEAAYVGVIRQEAVGELADRIGEQEG